MIGLGILLSLFLQTGWRIMCSKSGKTHEEDDSDWEDDDEDASEDE